MFNRALRDHITECLEARREAGRRIDEIEKKMDAGFGEARRKIDERHEQNQASLSKLYNGLWKVTLTILGALALSYLAQHGFNVAGMK